MASRILFQTAKRRSALLGGTLASVSVAYLATNYRTAHLDDIAAPAPGAAAQALAGLEYSQHAQVSMFWEQPGVYLFGSNKQGVANPSSNETYTKAPTRLADFDGMALRDLQVGENMGVAVLDNGDVVQWGDKYSGERAGKTEVTLRGKNIIRVQVSSQSIFALAQGGQVYALPFSRDEQLKGPKVAESAFFGLSSTDASISYKTVEVPTGDQITDIATGVDHLVMLTRSGKIYTAASSHSGNVRGQMGLPSYEHDSAASSISSQLVTGFRNAPAVAIAAGEHHSVVLDSDGEVFTYGSNGHGQLGFDFNADSQDVSTPTSVAVQQLYPRNYNVRCLKIAAGGKNTFMVTEAWEYGHPESVRIDIWAAGTGLQGQLGNNAWNHHQSRPVKVKSISGLREWDELNNKPIAIGVHSLSVGNTHIVCVLDNVAKIDGTVGVAAAGSLEAFHDVNYGRDVFLWGGNADFQMGTGKRNNRAMPEYIPPMESRAETNAVRSGWQPESGDHKRFQLTPAKDITIKSANGKRVKRHVEQAIIAGDRITACYAKVV
ncbi:hypothetical protein PYCC9005_003523 [Savitreella phatthalungensis]